MDGVLEFIASGGLTTAVLYLVYDLRMKVIELAAKLEAHLSQK